MRKIFAIAFFIDIVLIFFAIYLGKYALLNSQLAFIASLLIILGSFQGYKKVVQKKSHLGRDIIDEIEDRFELYNEEENRHLSAKELFEEEKKKVKSQKAMKNFILGLGGFFSMYRLLGYLFLVIAVMMLIRRSMFEPLSFLLGLAILPVSAMLYALFSRE